jgi:hypothetical protein
VSTSQKIAPTTASPHGARERTQGRYVTGARGSHKDGFG